MTHLWPTVSSVLRFPLHVSLQANTEICRHTSDTIDQLGPRPLLLSTLQYRMHQYTLKLIKQTVIQIT